MTCSKRFGRLLQASCLALIGTLAIAGCGGSESNNNKADTGVGGDVPGANSAILNLDRSSVNLGTLQIGQSGVATVTLTNTGKAPSAAIALTATPGIAATGCSGPLAANTSCTITITATASAPGTLSGTVTVTSGTLTPLQVSVLALVDSNNLFKVAPASIDLGNVAVGVPAPKQTITVTATVALTDLTITSSGADVSVDKAASTCTAAVVAGGTCNISVNFTAVSSGPKSDAIIINAGGKSVTVPVTAVAQNPAKLVILPATAQSFVSSVGQPSSAIAFGVANSGDVATGALVVAVTGLNATDFTVTNNCLILAPLAGCTVSVVYNPKAAGTSTAALTVTDSGAGASVVSVPLNGTALTGSTLVITPAAGDLGQVLVGATGAAVTFTVTNSGDAASGALTTAVSSGEVLIVNDTCVGASLAPKTGACTISLALKPTSVGPKSATLTVDGTASEPAVKMVTGTGTTPGALKANPAALDFGSVRVNKTATGQVVTVTNTGTTNTGVLSFTKGGEFAAFPITANTCSAALGPAATCTFTVGFAPTEAKSYTASYTVTDGSASATVAVSGAGLPAAGINILDSYDQVVTVVKECAGTTTCENPQVARAVAGDCIAKTVVGNTANPNTFTVRADALLPGMSDTGAITVALAGTNAADFAITKNNCTTPLLAGSECSIEVAFTPAAAGSRQASLVVTTVNGGSATVTLQSVGLAIVELVPLSKGADDASKDGLGFGQVPVLVDRNLFDVPVNRYRVIVRGPRTATSTTTTVLTTLADPTQPADFAYADGLTNPCNAANNGPKSLDFASATGVSGGWCYDQVVFSCDFNVEFYPQTVKGERTATLTSTTSGTGGAEDAKTLTGTATGPLTFDPAKVEFDAALQVGESSNVTLSLSVSGNRNEYITLTNNSTTADIGPLAVTLTGADFFIVEDRCSATTLAHVASGGSASYCVIGIGLLPTSVGAKTGTLTVTGSGETATAPITAGATDAYDITVSPNPYVFPTTAQTGSTWVEFTVSNPAASSRSAQIIYYVGDANFAAAQGAAVNGHDYGTCGVSGSTAVAPGKTCTIWVKFSPGVNTLADGVSVYEGFLYVGDASKSNVWVDVPLSGTVSSKLAITPAEFAFPATAEGIAVTTTLTVKNNGTVPATLVYPTPAQLAPFNIVQNGTTCAATLAAGATCNLVVNFVGVVGVPGKVGPIDLTIGDSDAVNSTATTSLTGTTVKPATLVAFGLDNSLNGESRWLSNINLGGVRKGFQSAPVTLTFQNAGSIATGPIHYQWSNAGVAGALDTQDSEFKIATETNGCASKTTGLAPGATCTVTINFAPTAATATGERSRQFTLSEESGSVVDVFTLTATALNPNNSAWFASTAAGNPIAFHTFPGLTVSGGGTTPPSQVFQFTNGSSAAIDGAILPTSSDGQFVVDATSTDGTAGTTPCGNSATLAVGQYCTFRVQFVPGDWAPTAAYRWATISVSGLPGTLGVIGRVKSLASIAITPTAADAFDFGQVVTTTSATKTLTVTNSGETATAALSFTLSNPAIYAVTGTCVGATLAGYDATVAGATPASCTATLTASPGNGLGDLSPAGDSVTVNGGTGVTATATGLAVEGVLNTSLAVNATSVTFPGTQAIGSESAQQEIVLNNVAFGRDSGVLTIKLNDTTNFSIVPTVGDCLSLGKQDPPVGLAGGAPCSLFVVFTPTALPATGTVLTTTVQFSATPGNSQTVTLTGTPVSSLSANPAGPVANIGIYYKAGLRTFPITITQASETEPTSYLKTSISGGNYIIVQDDCVATKLSAGQSCVIQVSYLGTADTPLKTGTLTVDGGAGGKVSVVLNSTANP